MQPSDIFLLARKLGRDEICIRFTATTFCEKIRGKDGIEYLGEGHIKDMDTFAKLFQLPDPDDENQRLARGFGPRRRRCI